MFNKDRHTAKSKMFLKNKEIYICLCGCNLKDQSKIFIISNLFFSTENREKCFELLICAGASLNLRNDEQKVPLDYPALQDFKRKRPDLFENSNNDG
jgi:hypothetical protein